MLVKSRVFIAVLGLAGFFLFSAAGLKRVSAQGITGAAPAAAFSKVAIIDIQEAIVNTNEGKKELESIQQRFAPKQTALGQQNDELEAMKKQFQSQAASLSDQDRALRLKNIEAKQKQLQRDYEDAQGEFQQAQQAVINRIAGKMVPILDKYANANGLTVVLDTSSPQTQVLWASKAANITPALIEAYNAGSPAAAAPAPPKSATPAPKGATPAPKTATPPPKKNP